uniref:U12-theraphotoxin-Cg1a n=1 Tax=Chilobrachys guangxiensis TaxID=278060 RepID=JZT15_CHIGU|nr:RecName: Full=U12-theraphotoxin-Cg1a; Short=U12-TRTX-Cg1a; AltName: Full=Jingzhaotoxin-15; Short=JZTX-15; AltName: Full=Peptide F4-19.71; Flags: Precursor [Chilobrachys guangxiensis]ABY71684.1 cystine knot toxin [Chilobrachys guangxiensis]
MKTSVLLFMLGLTFLFDGLAAINLQEGERTCYDIGELCSSDKPCCSGYYCSPRWGWCIYSTRGGR